MNKCYFFCAMFSTAVLRSTFPGSRRRTYTCLMLLDHMWGWCASHRSRWTLRGRTQSRGRANGSVWLVGSDLKPQYAPVRERVNLRVEQPEVLVVRCCECFWKWGKTRRVICKCFIMGAPEWHSEWPDERWQPHAVSAGRASDSEPCGGRKQAASFAETGFGDRRVPCPCSSGQDGVLTVVICGLK